jgi:hypothetical protein
MECPYCRSLNIYLKSPDDKYETREFDVREGEIARFLSRWKRIPGFSAIVAPGMGGWKTSRTERRGFLNRPRNINFGGGAV